MTPIPMPECWSHAEAVMAHAQRVLLYGPPGTGKSYLANMIGRKDKSHPPQIITLTQDTPVTDLMGTYIINDQGGFSWRDGVATRAWREGTRLALHEINRCAEDVETILYSVLDDQEVASYTLFNGETITPKSSFSAVATMNGLPEDLPEALQTRFAIKIHITEPHPAVYAKLPESWRAMARKSVTASNEDVRTNIRTWHEFRRLDLAGVPRNIAAAVTFGIEKSHAIIESITAGGL